MKYNTVFLVMLLSLLLVRCSGSMKNEPPESRGAENTNIAVHAELTLETAAVDVCNSVDTNASADITAETINEGLPANSLYLERYTVKYTALTDGAPPIEGATAYKTATLPADGITVLFMDAGRKIRYLSDITTGGYRPDYEFPRYRVEYGFYGRDRHGNDFGAIAIDTFRVGKYGGCETPLSVLPEGISLTGLANPDGDASDDITFHISGGRGPYSVYSDDSVVIEGKGTLEDGVSVFTVDPDTVAADTIVTLTVVDSDGVVVTVRVTVTPFSSTPASLSISPSAISVTGVANPDEDTSDDVTFYVSGGTEPYTVISNNTTVIAAPGELASGTMSFTVEPDAVTTDTAVTLTVTDSVGGSVTALITVTP